MSTNRCTIDEAVAAVRPADEIGIPLGPGQPGAFLHGLAARDDWTALTIYGALLVDLYELFTRANVHYQSGFFGPVERILVDAGHDVQFVPSDFRGFAPILFRRKPRIMATMATPPDADGNMSLSLHAGASIPELHRAGADLERVLLVETSPHFPRTRGLDPDFPHTLHVDEVDILIESDRTPFQLADPEPNDVDRAIAGHATRFASDGCTLQTGIGGIPSQIVKLLAEQDGGDYGVHSEMFTTGLMHLHQAGKVTNRKHGIYDGFSVTTFAAGTPELYEWLDGNDQVRFLPVDHVNSPELIAAQRKMLTINGAIAVDLQGQVVADTIGVRQYSGIGGHEDFVSAPGLGFDDRGLVCLPATATVEGKLVSRITPQLGPGSIVTTPRHQLDVVVTEYGAAELRGGTVHERALALAEIAHPDFREDLRQAAAQMR